MFWNLPFQSQFWWFDDLICLLCLWCLLSFLHMWVLQVYRWFHETVSVVFLLSSGPALSPVTATPPPKHEGISQPWQILAATPGPQRWTGLALCVPTGWTLGMRRLSKSPYLCYSHFFQYSSAAWWFYQVVETQTTCNISLKTWIYFPSNMLLDNVPQLWLLPGFIVTNSANCFFQFHLSPSF